MFNTPSQMVQEIFSFDRGSIPHENFTHPLRDQYPELVGSNGISTTEKQNWQKTDLIPIGAIIFFVISMVSFFGYYKPTASLAKINFNISRISTAFDQRANQINSMANRLDQFVIDNELPRELQNAISVVRNSVNTLSENKPNEEFIAERFAAEARFTELSASIIENRDLSLYGDFSELPDDFTDKDIVARGVKTLELVKQWGDGLSTAEEEAIDLLDIFRGKIMPKRTLELKSLMLSEWQGAQASLLENWMQLKELEITLMARAKSLEAKKQRGVERKKVLLKRQQEYELTQERRAQDSALIAKKRAAARNKQAPKKNRAKPVLKPIKKQTDDLERRKKAASKLFD